MRKYPAMAAAIFAGIYVIGATLVAYPATDNNAARLKSIHKSVGNKAQDCVKCHKAPALKRK